MAWPDEQNKYDSHKKSCSEMLLSRYSVISEGQEGDTENDLAKFISEINL